MTPKVTLAQMIWNALKDPPPELPGPDFTIEQIAVLCWQKYPGVFGLKGYEDRHPDVNKVVATVVGQKRMAHKGQLVRTAPGVYALGEPPPSGAENGNGRRVPYLRPANEDHENLARWLDKLSATRAYQKFCERGVSVVNRLDAMEFFGARKIEDLPIKSREVLGLTGRMRGVDGLDERLVNGVAAAAEAFAKTLPRRFGERIER